MTTLNADGRVKLTIGDLIVRVEVLTDQVAARDTRIAQLEAELQEANASLQAATAEAARRGEEIAMRDLETARLRAKIEDSQPSYSPPCGTQDVGSD